MPMIFASNLHIHASFLVGKKYYWQKSGRFGNFQWTSWRIFSSPPPWWRLWNRRLLADQNFGLGKLSDRWRCPRICPKVGGHYPPEIIIRNRNTVACRMCKSFVSSGYVFEEQWFDCISGANSTPPNPETPQGQGCRWGCNSGGATDVPFGERARLFALLNGVFF